MAYRESFGGFGGFHVTSWVKRLLIANLVLFIITQIFPVVAAWLSLQPSNVLRQPWGIVTYMFVHGGFWHLFGNMLALFFFGPPLEERWGSREFIKFYLICGLGGAALSFVFGFNAYVIGASGAVFGVMLAFAMNWPDVPIYIFGIFPIKAKYLVMILGAWSFLATITARGGSTAEFAHLGGLLAGFLYLKIDRQTGGPMAKFRRMVSRPKLTVVRGGGGVVQPRPVEKPRKRVDERVYDDVDRVLDKISTQGMASLTPEERKLLDEVSRRYRQN